MGPSFHCSSFSPFLLLLDFRTMSSRVHCFTHFLASTASDSFVFTSHRNGFQLMSRFPSLYIRNVIFPSGLYAWYLLWCAWLAIVYCMSVVVGNRAAFLHGVWPRLSTRRRDEVTQLSLIYLQTFILWSQWCLCIRHACGWLHCILRCEVTNDRNHTWQLHSKDRRDITPPEQK